MIVKFPISNSETRELYVYQFQQCPECGCDLDDNYECVSCKYDALEIYVSAAKTIFENGGLNDKAD